MKIGEPFSKAKNRKHLCLHYSGSPGGFGPGCCFSLLTKISETQCQCIECRKLFPIEKYDQMEELVAYLNEKGCITDGNLIFRLSEGIEPVYYRRISANEVEILDTGDKGIVIPRHFCIM